MRPWMLAMTARVRELITASFASDGTWAAPVATSTATVTGKGGAGQPGRAAYQGPSTTTYAIHRTRIQYYAGGGQSEPILVSVTESTADGPVPANYCFDDANGGQFCDTYNKLATVETGTYYPAIQPTTGPSSTALGRTFPGGTGGPATAVTYPAVNVVPGQTYPVKVAAGGFVEIRYEA